MHTTNAYLQTEHGTVTLARPHNGSSLMSARNSTLLVHTHPPSRNAADAVQLTALYTRKIRHAARDI